MSYSPLPIVHGALLSRSSSFNHLRYGEFASTTLQNDWGGFEVQTNSKFATNTATEMRWPQNVEDVGSSREVGMTDIDAYRMGDLIEMSFCSGAESVVSREIEIDLMDDEMGGHLGWKETFDKGLSENSQKITKDGEGQTILFDLEALFDMPTASFVNPTIALDERYFDFDELSAVGTGVVHDVHEVLCYDAVLQPSIET